MTRGTVLTGPLVDEGLERLRKFVFADDGPGAGSDAIVTTHVIYMPVSSATHGARTNGVWGWPHRDRSIPHELLDEWLAEVRRQSYVPGRGTWISCKVHLYPDAECSLEVADHELTDAEPGMAHQYEKPFAGAGTLATELRYFPRTVDNIPAWMWTVFRDAQMTPPVYNAELQAMEWNNRRRPVKEDGTDFSVEATVIDPAQEPALVVRAARNFGRSLLSAPGWVTGLLLSLLAVGGYVLNWAVAEQVHPVLLADKGQGIYALIGSLAVSLFLLQAWARSNGGGFRFFLYLVGVLILVVGDFMAGLPGLAFLKLGTLTLTLGALASMRKGRW